MTIDTHDHNATETTGETPAEVIPTVCPTCGSSRAGTAGAAHGCSSVPTMASKSGTGIVFAPMAVTDRCAECEQKAHRNLPRHEKDLLCLWQQFSAEECPTEGKVDRFGVRTAFAVTDAAHIESFARWMDRGRAKMAAVRGGPRVRKVAPVVTTSGTDPIADAIAADINAEPEVAAKPKRKTRAEKIAEEMAKIEAENEASS